MKRCCFAIALFCALAAPVLAEDQVYRCAAMDSVPWQGVPDIASNEIDLEPGRMEFTLDVAAGKYQQYYAGEAQGPADEVDVRHWSGEATRALPQIVAIHRDGNFTVRIALDNTPLRFALLYPVSIVTGTCVTENESADK